MITDLTNITNRVPVIQEVMEAGNKKFNKRLIKVNHSKEWDSKPLI